MTPLETFQNSIERCSHFITLYDLLHNKRQRKVRSDWAARFKAFMGWNSSDNIIRIDGERNILVIRPQIDLTVEQFDHEYVSELLRAAIVTSVSALDRYMHDLAVSNSIKILRRAEDQIPTEFKKLTIPVIEAKKAIKKIKDHPNSRPGHIIKKALQEGLHYKTYQGPTGIENCMAILGIKKIWASLSPLMPNTPNSETIKTKLSTITNRRNKIVHEADLIRRMEARTFSIRKITREEAEGSVTFIKNLVSAVDQVAISNLS